MNHRKYLPLLLAAIGVQFCKSAEGQTINYIQKDVVLTSGATTDVQVNNLGIASIQTSRTYIDGLGRPIQQVAVQGSPNSNKDIIQIEAYSSIGQQSVTYLPYVDNTGSYTSGSYRPNGLTDQGNYYTNNSGSTNKVTGDANPYSQKVFENSPFRRLLEAGNIGSGFQPGQHYKSFNYRSNNSTDNVLMWNSGGVYQNQYYPINSLSVTATTKEDGIATTITFTDNIGHIVLKREVLSPTKNLDTYYIYNNSGKLAFVVPPKAVALMTQNANYSLSQAGVSNLIFSNLYDNLGRLFQKNIPGSAPIYYIYDAYNRMVLIQDGNKRTVNQWFYIKYDVKDRPISHGVYSDLSSGHTGGISGGMQAFVNGLTSARFESRVGNTASYYTDNSFPTANSDNSPLQDLTYAYYDDYYLTQGANPDFQYQYQSLPGEPATNAATTLTRGMLTMVRRRTVGSGLNNIWLINVLFYDKKGNQIQTQSNNHLQSSTGGIAITDCKTNVLDFVGKPVVSLIKKVAGATGTTTVKTTLTYDAHNIRLLYVDQVYNTQQSIRIASYEYNELGQMVKKNLQPTNAMGSSIPVDVALGSGNSVSSGSSTTVAASHSIIFSPGTTGFTIPSGAVYNAYISNGALQSLDYRYNIRGQITSINNSTLTNDGGATNGDTNDLFGMQIMYDQPDIALNSSTITATPSFMGKISAVKWMTVDYKLAKTNERSYVYTYDEVGRLTAANYAERSTGTIFNVNQNGFDEAGITYDENGNIKTLNRNSSSIGATSSTQVDQLVYSYDASDPNRLASVSDANNSTSTQYTGFGFRNITGTTNGTYSYDANGNLNSDPYKGLTLGYNLLNKTDNIKIVTGGNGVAITGRYINYTYDASGTVIRKQQYDNGGQLVTITDYVDGFVYVNNTLSYFPMGEGRVLNSGGTLKPEYIIADQQGNARFSFQDGGNGTVKIIQENSYYAFGLGLANSPVTMPTIPNKQLYNGGSEWQNDYNNLPDYYQTNNRNYDAALGRFIAVDPLAESSYSMGIYHYAKNDPLSFNDPSGNDPGGDGGDPSDDPGPEEGYNSYGGYDTDGESKGSSTTGTNEGGAKDGNGHNSYTITESGAIINGPTSIDGNNDVYYLAPNSGFDPSRNTFTQVQTISPSEAYIRTFGAIGNQSDWTVPGNDENDNPAGSGIISKDVGGNGSSGEAQTMMGKINNGISAFGIGLSVNNELWDFAVRTSFKSANTISEWNALRVTQQTWRLQNALGETGAKFLNASKGVGKIANVAGVVLVIGNVAYNGRIAPSDVLDGVVATVAFIPVYGWAISGLYFIGDAATKQITGESIEDHLNNYYGDPALGHWTW